jgi:large subunit ribosomal protein L9
MDIILLERVDKLGAIGDVVTVRDGYARNFLLPQNKALRATEANKKRFDAMRAELETRNAETRTNAQSMGEKLEGQSFTLIRQAGESGQLYGSVSARDVSDAAQAAGFQAPRAAVILEKPIKTLGIHPIKVRLHPEVVVNVSLNVARSPDEAERQAKGEDVIKAAQQEEREQANAQAAEIAAVSEANQQMGD